MRREVRLSKVEHAREVIHYWRTKDGININVKLMGSGHLLNTIHMLEKSRYENLSSFHDAAMEQETQTGMMTELNYYREFPEAYQHLLDEAERRRLIKRSK